MFRFGGWWGKGLAFRKAGKEDEDEDEMGSGSGSGSRSRSRLEGGQKTSEGKEDEGEMGNVQIRSAIWRASRALASMAAQFRLLMRWRFSDPGTTDGGNQW